MNFEFNYTWNFPTHCRKIFKCEILRKSFQLEPSCSNWMDRLEEANSRFSQFYDHTEKDFPVSEDSKVVTIHAISQELSRLQSVNIVTVCGGDMKWDDINDLWPCTVLSLLYMSQYSEYIQHTQYTWPQKGWFISYIFWSCTAILI